MGSFKQQKGVVLILALLIVALVTTVVVSVTWRFNLSMARNENRWHGAQARAYLEAAEMLACLGLRADFEFDPESDPKKKTDNLGEDWALPGTPYPVDEGWVRGQIEDAQGRINLNLLLPETPSKPEDPPKRSAAQERFIRFLQLIELKEGVIDESTAKEIVDAIADWIDEDSNVSSFGGAESSYYESLDPPYPIANREMATTSELSMVKGMIPELFTQIQPYIIALPGRDSNGQTTAALMNINTMKPLLLQTLNRKENLTPLTEEEGQSLIQARGGVTDESASASSVLDENRPPQGFKTIKEFIESPAVTSILGDKDKFDSADFTVLSNYFLLSTETLVGEQVRRGKALVYRHSTGPDTGKARVIRRTSANF